MKLSLGPIQYFWTADQVREFYRQVISWPVDIVYLGETVCAKRNLISFDEWLAIGKLLAESGKDVVLSSLTLLEAESDLSKAKRLAENGCFEIEANDMSAVSFLAGKKEFIAGSFLNTYNTKTLQWLSSLGMKRWVVPAELDNECFKALLQCSADTVQSEILAYGKLPLSFSARCFAARAHHLPKDNCQYKCLDYPDGLSMKTQDKQEFLTINGIQVQSGEIYNLILQVPELKESGVDILRLSPQLQDMEVIVKAFDDVINESIDCSDALNFLSESLETGFCNGYWFKEPGMRWFNGTEPLK